MATQDLQPGETFQHPRLGLVKVLTIADDGQTAVVLTEGGETVTIEVPAEADVAEE